MGHEDASARVRSYSSRPTKHGDGSGDTQANFEGRCHVKIRADASWTAVPGVGQCCMYDEVCRALSQATAPSLSRCGTRLTFALAGRDFVARVCIALKNGTRRTHQNSTEFMLL